MRGAMVGATHEAAQASGGRPVPAANLHVTLAFLGSVPERRLEELAEIARAAAARPGRGADSPLGGLDLTFDRLEYWRQAQLLCALPAEAQTPIATLARGLQDALAASEFDADLKPFRPHVTVVRKVHRSPRTMELQPVTWTFTDFVLVDSTTLPEGPAYTVLERFPLGQ
jgi:RNA 2',3'-cyclic 3'-phosphodiesterase